MQFYKILRDLGEQIGIDSDPVTGRKRLNPCQICNADETCLMMTRKFAPLLAVRGRAKAIRAEDDSKRVSLTLLLVIWADGTSFFAVIHPVEIPCITLSSTLRRNST
jgi:hypothetical protein